MNEKSVGRRDYSNGHHTKSGYSGSKNGYNRHKGGGKGRDGEKFVPNFKKREPTWKRIDAELKELIPKYDEVFKLLNLSITFTFFHSFSISRLIRIRSHLSRTFPYLAELSKDSKMEITTHQLRFNVNRLVSL